MPYRIFKTIIEDHPVLELSDIRLEDVIERAGLDQMAEKVGRKNLTRSILISSSWGLAVIEDALGTKRVVGHLKHGCAHPSSLGSDRKSMLRRGISQPYFAKINQVS